LYFYFLYQKTFSTVSFSTADQSTKPSTLSYLFSFGKHAV